MPLRDTVTNYKYFTHCNVRVTSARCSRLYFAESRSNLTISHTQKQRNVRSRAEHTSNYTTTA